MKFTTTHVDVWSTEIEDKAGGLARTLRAIADFGANLDYVAAQRLPEKPGKGILLISSSDSRLDLGSVTDMGLRRVTDRPMLKIEGHDEPGLGAKLARAVADAGVNAKGLSADVSGSHFVCHVEFDSVQDRDKAETALDALNTHQAWAFWRRHATKAA